MTANSVWYTGSSDKRSITAAQWTAKGVTQADTVWDHTNGWGILASTLAGGATTFLATQSDFTTATVDPLLSSRPAVGGVQPAVEYVNMTTFNALVARVAVLEA